MPTISVIVPVYKVERFLPRCINSILSQSFTDFELILIDDGSPDKCGAICDSYAAKDTRIKVIHQKNAGVFAARNAGLAVATGDYVALIDSDDWIHNTYFEILIHFAKLYHSEITICGYAKTSEDIPDRPIDIKSVKSYTASGLKALDDDSVTHGYVWARLFKRRIIEGQSFSGVKVLDDAAFNFDVISTIENIRCSVCDAKLYYYFHNPNSMMSGFGPESTKQVAEYYYLKFKDSDSSWQKYVYAIEILKNTIHFRYAVMFKKDREKLCMHNKTMMKHSLQEIDQSPFSSIKTKTVYRLLTSFPILYRVFRIVTDPTMLDWEKNQKVLNFKGNE